MAVLALASAKGAPGVTTAALGLAVRWPRPAILVEADPAGGDLAPRFVAHRSPGLAEWAADSRMGSYQAVAGQAHASIGHYAQRLVGIGADVVFGASSEQMPTAVSLLVAAGALADENQEADPAGATTGQAPDVLLDLGRLDFSSAVLGLAPHATLLLVARGWPDSVAALVSRRDALLHRLRMLAGSEVPGGVAATPRIGVLLIGEMPYARGEIQAVVGLPVLGVLPHDVRGADVLSGRRDPGRAWTRSPLLRACRSLAADLHAQLHPVSALGVDARTADAGAAGALGRGHASPDGLGV
jgi:hypothetical protein